MEVLAGALRRLAGDYLRDPVFDRTGLTGAFDFDLKWNPRSRLLPPGVARITIFDAVEKQLGLALEPQEIPMPVVIVDRVNEKPTANPPGVAQILPPRAAEFEVATVRLSAALSASGLEMRKRPLPVLVIDHIEEKAADN